MVAFALLIVRPYSYYLLEPLSHFVLMAHDTVMGCVHRSVAWEHCNACCVPDGHTGSLLVYQCISHPPSSAKVFSAC